MLLYLWTKGSELQPFSLNAIIKLICIVAKLGWLHEMQRNLIEQVEKFIGVRLPISTSFLLLFFFFFLLLFCFFSLFIIIFISLLIFTFISTIFLIKLLIKKSTIEHRMIGLRILDFLIEEFNAKSQHQSYSIHRKISNLFRDHSLVKIFDFTLESLQIIRRENSHPGMYIRNNH